MVPLKSSKRNQMKLHKGRDFRPFLYLMLCGFPIVGVCQTDRQLTFMLDSFNYSEATSLHSISGHWSDTVSAGNEAISVSRITLGYQDKNYSVQAIVRDDTYYRFDNETAQFIYQIENSIPLENGQNFALFIKPDKSSSKGFRFGIDTEVSQNLKLAGFISLLRPTNLIQGSLVGQAVALDTNDYDFNFTTDLVYEDDPLFDRTTDSLSGKGYSIDLIIDYMISENWSLNLQLLDVMGELKIDEAGYTRADATSDIKVFDENGYLQYDPVITGKESYKDFVYQFEMQTHLSLAYQMSNKNSLVLQHHRIFDFEYQKFVFLQSNNQNQLSWSLIPQLKAAGFSFKHPNFSFGIETDSLNYKKMKYLNLNTQFYWTF